MKVYVCCRGERCEGQSPYAVYTSLRKAVKRIQKDVQDHEDTHGWGVLKHSMVKYEIGCDIFRVETFTVEGNGD